MPRLWIDGRWQEVNADTYSTPAPAGTTFQEPAKPAGPQTEGRLFGPKPMTRPSRGNLPAYNPVNYSPGRFAPIPGDSAQVNRSDSPDYPDMPGASSGRTSGYKAAPYNPPAPIGDKVGYSRLGAVTLDPPPRIGREAAPDRVGEFRGYEGAPAREGGYAGLPSAPSRAGADRLIARLGGGVSLPERSRETLGGPAGNNELEALALRSARRGADPGSQFTGKTIRDEVFSGAQVNQMAQQRAAPTIRAFQDAQRMAAEAGGRGGSMDPARVAAASARAAIEGAGALSGATRDAQLEAAAANAAQEARAAENQRANYETDTAARLGLGRLALDETGQLITGGLQRRGLDQQRDIAGFEGNITQRGQDFARDETGANLNLEAQRAALEGEIATRGQDIGYATEGGRQSLEARGQNINQRGQEIDAGLTSAGQRLNARGQDVTQRGQEMDFSTETRQQDIAQRAADMEQEYRAAGLSAEQARARVQAELTGRGQSIEQSLGLGRLSEDARQANIASGDRNREMDIAESLGLDRLGVDRYRAEADVANQIAERSARMDQLDAELADRSIDRTTRAQLEQQRMQLQQELAQLQTRQQENQFGANYALDNRRVDLAGEQLAEEGRQADQRYDLGNQAAETSRYNAEVENRLGLDRLNIDRYRESSANNRNAADTEATIRMFAERINKGINEEELRRLLDDARYGSSGLPSNGIRWT